MDYEQLTYVIAAKLAAALPLQDEKATVQRYRRILAELREGGGPAADSKGKVV
jgi:hypothetical protein